jgi:serine phosphatase RsbU (regulator of sigma subunit)
MEIRGGSQAVEESFAMPGLDAWVYSRPYEGADEGGDLHYLSVCGGGVITRLVVADISGHGATAADFSSSLHALMRKNINTKSQTGLVRSLNQQFAEMAQSRRFATAVIATYLATHQKLTVCNAGHPRPLWFRSQSERWSVLEGDSPLGNLPLGVDDESPYTQFSVVLGPGDIVLFYTDALTEAADAASSMLGEEGLLNLARSHDPADPGRLGSALLAGVAEHRGGRPADDDVTLLILHHNAGGPRRLSIGEKLDVYAKVLGLKHY